MTPEEKKMKYEITMYKLLVIFLVGLFVALFAGFMFGSIVGYAQGTDDVTVKVPDYCSVKKAGINAEVNCMEFSNFTARELCSIVSTPIADRIRVLVVG